VLCEKPVALTADRTAGPSMPTLRGGLVVQRVIDAAWRSSAGARWVSLAA
jgi:predicted dehydrogenase